MYNKGDYIMLSDSDAWFRNYALVYDISEDRYFIRVFFPNSDGYVLYFRYSGFYYKWVNINFIERKMTSNEKKDLEILMDADKFNI